MSHLQHSLSGLLLFATLGTVAPAQQATFTPIPGSTYAGDVTPDGSIIVGSGGGQAFVWDRKNNPAPIFIGGKSATSVSDDGMVITGDMKDPSTGKEIAGVWNGNPQTGVGTWTPLHPGQLGDCGSISSGYDVTGDGKHVVGLGWEGCSGRGFVADSTAPTPFTQMLENLGNGNNRSSTISRNGRWIGGFAQGSFSRSPAVWDPTAPLVTPPAPGLPYYPGILFDINATGEIHGISDDGTILLGEWINAAGTNHEAFYWANWENDLAAKANFVYIGKLNPGPNWSGIAVDMAEPVGSSSVPPLIVGFDSPGFGGEAWVWTPAGGIVQLEALLTALGVPSVPALNFCLAVTPNGGTIIGHTFFGGAWIVDFPTPGQVSVYGCDGNPAGSMSVLSGTPEVGKTLTLGLDNPLGSQPAGSLPFVFLATQPSPLYPCGTSLPGTGMGGGAGELLIDIIPPNPILPAIQGFPWAGPGSPAQVPLAFPVLTNLIGKKLYAQGVMIDLSFAGIPLALTDAVDMTIGG